MADENVQDSNTYFAQRNLENLLDLFNANPTPGMDLTFEIYELCRSFDFQIPPQVMDKLLNIFDGYARRHREDHPAKFTHPKDYFPEYSMVNKLVYWGCRKKSNPPGKWEDYFPGIPIEKLKGFFDKPSQNTAIDLVAEHIAFKDPVSFRRLFQTWKKKRKSK